ncbi:MAG: STY1053 family phage-associated protein [Providencia sp.]|uniref:STY1053 family phage-associated protein n=1 Tax=Providencia sp. TaxID=589 RepID=UPI003F96511E
MKIQVHTPFNLTLGTGDSVHYAIGIHEVSQEVGEHWFTQAHSTLLSSDEPPGHERVIAELEALIMDKDMQITELTKQINNVDVKTEKPKDGKKSDAANGGTVQK